MYARKILACLLIVAMLTPFQIAFGADVVRGKKEYSYEKMEQDLLLLAESYPELVTLKTIGTSEYGRNLYAISIGTGTPTAFINASHHAREYFTTAIVMNQIQDLLTRQQSDDKVKELLQHVTFWFVPMVNPDGVTLVQQGTSAFPQEDRSKLLAMNGGSSNFARWKANAKGVDLNRQYPADWANIKQNASKPSYANHKGTTPLQAKEAQALLSFTYEIDPQMSISYHSSGQIVFWSFHTDPSHKERDRTIVTQFSQMTGYKPVAPTANPSGGGYTDWFISAFKRPALTPEVAPGVGERPVPISYFDSEWKRNKEVTVWMGDHVYKLWQAQVKPVFVEEKITLSLNGNVKLYTAPNKNKYAQAMLTQESIVSTAHWDKWYRVQTWLGDSYIYMDDLEQPDTIQTVTLTKSTPMYAYPYASSQSKGMLSPQKVQVLAKNGVWHKIQTWLGPMWIKVY